MVTVMAVVVIIPVAVVPPTIIRVTTAPLPFMTTASVAIRAACFAAGSYRDLFDVVATDVAGGKKE